jgi:hypothetical protein
MIIAVALVTAEVAKAQEPGLIPEGIFCAQVIPDCDKEGNVTGPFADPSSPCLSFYSSFCVKKRLQEVNQKLLVCQALSRNVQSKSKGKRSRGNKSKPR